MHSHISSKQQWPFFSLTIPDVCGLFFILLKNAGPLFFLFQQNQSRYVTVTVTIFLEVARSSLVRFPNCHECQLGFQCPKKLEIGKQWPVVEKNYIATVIKLGKLTSSASQEKMSAKKNSQRFMVSRLEDQTCPPLNPHFGWRPISLGGFVLLMKLYLRELIFPISHQSNSKRY